MMLRSASIAIAILACFAFPPVVLCAGPYNATWASLDTRPVPTWYEDAKFGIFIHWGVYSVPAFGDVGRQYAEWYWHDLVGNPNGVVAAFHNATYGPNFKYTQFTDSFKAELFDASQWADLIKRSGAKYVVPTSKHHEGFTLWPSTQSWNWNAKDVGPHRDLLNEIMTAVRAAGLHAGLYFSLYEWFHPMYIGPNPKDYVTQVMDPQWRDLISNYRPDLLWCDGAWEKSSDFWESKEFLAWVYNESPVADRIIVNDRFGNDTQGKHGGFYTAEYQPNVWLDHKWEENSGVDVFSYGYNRATPEDKYFTTESLVQLLVRCVSNNGNFLLDIGPDADGTIPTVEQQRLLEIGEWLQQNGEGIYGSRVWRVQQDGTLDATNVRYTYQPTTKTVYAFVLTWPDSGQVVLQAPIPTSNTTVTFLGLNTQLTYKPLNNDQDQDQKHAQPGLSVTFPSYNPSRNLVKYVWCLKLENVM